jgi:YD repeat-containing protein
MRISLHNFSSSAVRRAVWAFLFFLGFSISSLAATCPTTDKNELCIDMTLSDWQYYVYGQTVATEQDVNVKIEAAFQASTQTQCPLHLPPPPFSYDSDFPTIDWKVYVWSGGSASQQYLRKAGYSTGPITTDNISAPTWCPDALSYWINNSSGTPAFRFRSMQCPAGYSILRSGLQEINYCTMCPAGATRDPNTYACLYDAALFRTKKRNTCGFGNPIFPATGTKVERVESSVFIGRTPFTLTYDTAKRAPTYVIYGTTNLSASVDPTFASLAEAPGFGELWLSSFHLRVAVAHGARRALVSRGDGRIVSFVGDGVGGFVPDADINDKLISIPNGFRYIDSVNNAIEIYDASGNITSRSYASGEAVSFAYSDANTPLAIAPAPGYLISVTDSFGRLVRFAYQATAPLGVPRVVAATDVTGNNATAAYDTQGNLSQLTWADGTSRQFLYERSDLRWALTGVIDERGIRRSTFAYDAEGRAISTENAGGINRFVASYTTPPTTLVAETVDWPTFTRYRTYEWGPVQGIAVTDPNGTVSSLTAQSILGDSRITAMNQPAGSGCAASAKETLFDSNGGVVFKSDFNGNHICYANDVSRNLETARWEGLASNAPSCSLFEQGSISVPADARVVSTSWHPDWRLEARRAEPGRLTTWIYNGQPDPFSGGANASCAPPTASMPDGKPIAVLCKQVEQATTDANGSVGFSATIRADIPVRQSSWTYNQYGQVLTAKGARTDVNDTTTYVYYADTTVDHTWGDLRSVTNAVGKTVMYDRYNKAGQLLQGTDANGVVTINTYDLRQRLLSTSVGGETTSYVYDPAGQLVTITPPNGSSLTNTYDAAHRLSQITDSAGNKVIYSLDAAGNRVGEQVQDTSGTLLRSIVRSFDALNRVQLVTGARQ